MGKVAKIQVNPAVLLSNTRKEQAEAAVERFFVLAEQIYNRKFPRPITFYNIKNKTAGMAYFHQNWLRFNLVLFVENEEDYLVNTVGHEVAHLVCDRLWADGFFPEKKDGVKLKSHGAQWKKVMVDMGLKPETKHTYDCTSIESQRMKTALKEKGIGVGHPDMPGAIMISLPKPKLTKVERAIRDIEKLNLDDGELAELKKLVEKM